MTLLDAEVALGQIDPILAVVRGTSAGSGERFAGTPPTKLHELRIRTEAAIERLAPTGSPYLRSLRALDETLDGYALERLAGILQALREDYEAGYLRTLQELIHRELFGDFLEMAGHLLDNGYTGPAAVVAGTVLEGHLRKMAEKGSVELVDARGRPKAVELLGAELVKTGGLTEPDRKQVTAWYALRTKAAHGHGAEIAGEQVRLMIDGVRDFVRRNPA